MEKGNCKTGRYLSRNTLTDPCATGIYQLAYNRRLVEQNRNLLEMYTRVKEELEIRVV